MKQIKSIELVALNGGAAASDCMSQLQYEANTHQNSGNKEQDDAFGITGQIVLKNVWE